MRNTIIIIALLAVALQGHAQNWDEWFRQRATQKKYLVQQIVALKVYAGYAKKGYKIANDGLTTIGGFTRGEFDLHGNYFSSLKTVNPTIQKDPKIEQIHALHEKIKKQSRSSLAQLRTSEEFSHIELAYFQRVYDRLIEDCQATLDQLEKVTNSRGLEMKDDERMSRINELFLDMQDKYTFFQSFSNGAKKLAISRTKERRDLQTSRKLNGIEK